MPMHILTVPFDAIHQCFPDEDLKRFLLDKRVRSTQSAFFQHDGHPYWTVLIEYPPSSKIPCKRCGAMILPATAAKTGGLCMPCYSFLIRELDLVGSATYSDGSAGQKGSRDRSQAPARERLLERRSVPGRTGRGGPRFACPPYLWAP